MTPKYHIESDLGEQLGYAWMHLDTMVYAYDKDIPVLVAEFFGDDAAQRAEEYVAVLNGKEVVR